jgi:hypothetical protein
MGWIKSKFQGVRYREHPTRKHGLLPDRYYTIFYKLDGKMVQEALGWSSESWEEQINGEKKRANWTEKRAAGVLAELQKNQSVGTGPRTLKEKRALKEKAQAILKAESLTLAEFWEQDYQHVLKARIKPTSWKKEVSHFKNRIQPAMGNKALTSITSVDVERMVDQMRVDELTPRTQQYAVGTFFRIWKHAAKRKLVKIGDNPALAVPVKQVNNTRLRILSPEELKNILQHLATSDPAAHDITLFCAIVRVELLLFAMFIDDLPKIALSIEQSYSDDRHTKIACSFELISSYIAQAARIDGKNIAQHKFHAKIGNTSKG